MVEVATQKRRVLALAIHGNCDERSLRKLADKTLDDLTSLPNITQVEIMGIRKPEISIEVSERNLREHGLSFDEVSQSLKQSSLDIPGGVARTSSGETLLRAMGKPARRRIQPNRIDFLPQRIKLETRGPGNSQRRFRRQGSLHNLFRPTRRNASRFQGGQPKPSGHFGESKCLCEGNYAQITRGGQHDHLARQLLLPAGRLQMMIRNAFQGLLLVFLVLSLFLRPSLAVWVAIGLPISFMGAFAAMGVIGHPSTSFRFCLHRGVGHSSRRRYCSRGIRLHLGVQR